MKIKQIYHDKHWNDYRIFWHSGNYMEWTAKALVLLTYGPSCLFSCFKMRKYFKNQLEGKFFHPNNWVSHLVFLFFSHLLTLGISPAARGPHLAPAWFFCCLSVSMETDCLEEGTVNSIQRHASPDPLWEQLPFDRSAERGQLSLLKTSKMCLGSTFLPPCISADVSQQSLERRDGAPSVFHGASVSGEARQLSGGPRGKERGIEDKRMKGFPMNRHQQSNCARERLLTRYLRNIWQLCIYFPVK